LLLTETEALFVLSLTSQQATVCTARAVMTYSVA